MKNHQRIREHRAGGVRRNLAAAWFALVGSMSYLFGQPQTEGSASVLALAAMIPIVRLAACPLAMAANRHG